MNEIENCLILSLWKKKVNKRKMNSTREPKHGRILLAKTGLAGKGGTASPIQQIKFVIGNTTSLTITIIKLLLSNKLKQNQNPN
jgi:hypothetical protein